MKLTRRSFVAGSAALTAGMVAPGLGRVWAASALDMGQMRVQAISDGYLTLPGDFLFSTMAPEDIAPIIAKYDLSRDQLTPDCTVTMLDDGERKVLFDVGSGPDFMPSAGKLPEALDALGVTPDEITHVVFTHAHPDHLWGLLDEFDEPLFPEATYMMGAEEWDYWFDPATVDSIGEARAAFAVGAKRRLDALEDRVVRIKAGEEILPGVQARESFGHTPGHLAFELRSGSESLMIVGDAVANHHVAFERPGLVGGSDQDGERAARTRMALLDQIATEKMRMIGFHLPYPGIGRTEKSGDGYVFVAEEAAR